MEDRRIVASWEGLGGWDSGVGEGWKGGLVVLELSLEAILRRLNPDWGFR